MVAHRLFGDVQEAVQEYSKILRGEAPAYVDELIRDLSSRGFRVFEVDPPGLLAALSSRYPECKFVELSSALDLERLFAESRLVEDVYTYRRRLREVLDALVTAELKKAVSGRDMMIVHAVHVLEDLDKHINIFYTRCREWYGLHFPELAEVLDEPEQYMRVVWEFGSRNKLEHGRLAELVGEKKAREVMERSSRSIGADLDPEDEEQIRMIAQEGLRLIEMRKMQEGYIRDLMSSEAPNLSAVAGAILGAKLISLAGGLEKLARMPASTIQVLGAEKALFRFFRTGRGAPKHGVIFQHPYIHGSPKWQRGKIARLLATKIAIAARIDYFSREDRSGELRKALEERLAEIRKKYSQPPARKEKAERPPVKRPPRRRRPR